MKCLYVLFTLFSYALATSVFFTAPPPDSTFSPGQEFVVAVEQHDSLSSSEEVSVAIGLISCVGMAPAGTCDGVDTAAGGIGTILFAGPYNPTMLPQGQGAPSVGQNYTVTVPAGFQKGPTVLSVAHFNTVGAVNIPTLQVANETVFIQ